MDNIEMIISKLENEIKNAKRAVLSNNKIIDEIKCLDFISALKESLPSAIMEAGYIMEDKEKIIKNAREQAKNIVERAEFTANQLVMDSEIVKRASADADAIVIDAKKYANYVRHEAEDAIDRLLHESEDNLMRILSDIRACRDDIQGK